MERNLNESVYELRARALDLQAGGASLKEICEAMGIHLSVALRVLGVDSLRAQFEKMEFSEAKDGD